jgi:predicted RNA-binding Zn ribbon-like protein
MMESLLVDGNASRAGSLDLVGGVLCLDFANTASGRDGARHMDHLQTYRDLLDWCGHAGILGAPALDRLRARAGTTPEAAALVLRRAVALREAIHGIGAAMAAREVPDPDLVRGLTREIAAAMTEAGLDRVGVHYYWGWPEETDDLARPLWPIAFSASVMFPAADPRRLKICPGPDCGWLFLDRSKNISRRWCDMAVCGNRAKARRFHAKARAG